MTGEESLALSKSYTNKVALGQGAVQVPGPPGQGLTAGGTTGQLLSKKSSADFDTEWADAPDLTGFVKQQAIDKSVGEHNEDDAAHGIDVLKKAIEDLENPGGVIPADLISEDQHNALALGTDDKLFVPESSGGGYSPPQGGIPKSDLAQGVQESLALADTALQGNDLSGYVKQADIDASIEEHNEDAAAHGIDVVKSDIEGIKSDIEDLQNNGGNDPVNWGAIGNKPEEFPPEAHTHELSDVTDFDADHYATAAQGALADTALQEETDPVYTADKPTIALKTDLAQKMPTAPLDGEVHGASGDTWYVLEDIAKRAVIMIGEALSVTETGNTIAIDRSDFDRLDEFTVDYNGARAVFGKGSPVNELYSVGENRTYYRFEFDRLARTITITDIGRLLLDDGVVTGSVQSITNAEIQGIFDNL